MDAWADLHLSNVVQRRAEQRADAARERIAQTTVAVLTGGVLSGSVTGPAAPRRDGHGLGTSATRACADCPAGQPA